MAAVILHEESSTLILRRRRHRFLYLLILSEASMASLLHKASIIIKYQDQCCLGDGDAVCYIHMKYSSSLESGVVMQPQENAEMTLLFLGSIQSGLTFIDVL